MNCYVDINIKILRYKVSKYDSQSIIATYISYHGIMCPDGYLLVNVSRCPTVWEGFIRIYQQCRF